MFSLLTLTIADAGFGYDCFHKFMRRVASSNPLDRAVSKDFPTHEKNLFLIQLCKENKTIFFQIRGCFCFEIVND